MDEMSMPPYSELLSTLALCISIVSLGVSFGVAFRDRARLKVTSEYFKESEFGPNRIVVTMVNVGRRPIILRLIGGIAPDNRWSGSYLDPKNGGLRLGEHERHEHIFIRDETMYFNPENRAEAVFFETLWVEDSLGVRHAVPKSERYLKRLWA